MRLPLAFAVLLLASAQALGEEMGTSDDLSYWSDSDQAKVSPGAPRGAGPRGSEPGALSRALPRAGLSRGVRTERRPLSPRRRSCRCPWSTSCRGWPGDPGLSSSSASWANGMPVSGAGVWLLLTPLHAPLLPVPAQILHGYRSGLM